jgi:hypothetical protein
MLQLEPREDLKKRSGKSLGCAESIMLTFADRVEKPGIRADC